jgi:hypothetical protein
MESLLFWFLMLASSLLMTWYVTGPILLAFYCLSWYCIKRFSQARNAVTAAIILTLAFMLPLSWISMNVLYKLGKIDFL